MGRRTRSVCSHPGCPSLSTTPYCPLHTKRKPSGTSGYDSRWKKIRNEHLRYEPYCVACGVVATQVDHVIPRTQGGSDHSNNLQSLCDSHHSFVTSSFDGGFGNPINPQGKRDWYEALGIFIQGSTE